MMRIHSQHNAQRKYYKLLFGYANIHWTEAGCTCLHCLVCKERRLFKLCIYSNQCSPVEITQYCSAKGLTWPQLQRAAWLQPVRIRSLMITIFKMSTCPFLSVGLSMALGLNHTGKVYYQVIPTYN